MSEAVKEPLPPTPLPEAVMGSRKAETLLA